jgi:hypothetical protein
VDENMNEEEDRPRGQREDSSSLGGQITSEKRKRKRKKREKSL